MSVHPTEALTPDWFLAKFTVTDALKVIEYSILYYVNGTG
jgi:hypothetical protein